MNTARDQAIIQRIYLDYAATIDNEELAAWPSYFSHDAVYRIISKENFDRHLPLALMYCEGEGMLKDRAHASADLNVYAPRTWRHMISNMVVRRTDALTTGEANFLLLETVEGKPTQILVAGRYLDVILDSDGEVKLARRTVVYDTGLIPGSVVFPI